MSGEAPICIPLNGKTTQTHIPPLTMCISKRGRHGPNKLYHQTDSNQKFVWFPTRVRQQQLANPRKKGLNSSWKMPFSGHLDCLWNRVDSFKRLTYHLASGRVFWLNLRLE